MLVMPAHSTNSQNCFVGIGISGCNEPLYRRSILRLTLTVNPPCFHQLLLTCTFVSVPGRPLHIGKVFLIPVPSLWITELTRHPRTSGNRAEEEGSPRSRTRARWLPGQFPQKRKLLLIINKSEVYLHSRQNCYRSIHEKNKISRPSSSKNKPGAMLATLDDRREEIGKNNSITRNDRSEEI